jgi:hypothetical protein
MAMKWLVAICIGIGLLALLAFLPTILSFVLDPLYIWQIRRYCAQRRLENVEIKAWPNHYGVHFSSGGQKKYAKCSVIFGKIRWKGPSPEHL